jgi:glycosyltransferase involved in cell wall biosynthesis
MKKCLIITPIFNESKALSGLMDRLHEIKLSDIKISIDVLFINDGSEDESENILMKKNANYISLVNNLGIGGAMQSGYIFANDNGYEYVVQIDGDGQHPPEKLKQLIISAEKSDEDLIIGSRFISSNSYRASLTRRIGMIYSSWLLKIITGIKIYDTTSGFRLTKRELIQFFAKDYPQHEAGLVSLLMAVKAGFSFKEIPIQINKRTTGKSSINTKRALLYPFKTIVNSINYILRK